MKFTLEGEPEEILELGKSLFIPDKGTIGKLINAFTKLDKTEPTSTPSIDSKDTKSRTLVCKNCGKRNCRDSTSCSPSK